LSLAPARQALPLRSLARALELVQQFPSHRRVRAGKVEHRIELSLREVGEEHAGAQEGLHHAVVRDVDPARLLQHLLGVAAGGQSRITDDRLGGLLVLAVGARPVAAVG
jgi:hypothetical protein